MRFSTTKQLGIDYLGGVQVERISDIDNHFFSESGQDTHVEGWNNASWIAAETAW